MDTPSLLSVAFGLAMGAFSVSVAYGLKSQRRRGEALKMGFILRVFSGVYAGFRLACRFGVTEHDSLI